MKFNRFFLACGWTVAVLFMLAIFGWQIQRGLNWETDVLALLPVTEQDPVVEKAVRTFSGRIGQKTVFLIGHEKQEVAVEAADRFAEALRQSSVFDQVFYRNDGGESDFFDLYFPHRYRLLSQETRAVLDGPNGGEALVRRATETLYGPMTAAVSGFLEDDPLLLFPAYLQSFPKPPGDLKAEDGRMTVADAGLTYVFLSADLVGSAFSANVQDAAITFLEEIQADLSASWPNLEVLSTGVLQYAHAGTQSARREISTIGLGSLLGIVALLLVVFRSFRPLWMSVLPILAGCLTALVATFAIFGEVHVLTLVFGASLVGVCIDYSFHFFCERYLGGHGADPNRAMTIILPAISLGALTSILGYMGLLLAPFPGLKQMAAFSSLGLLGAFATVVCWFPALARIGSRRQGSRRIFLLETAAGYLRGWRRFPGLGIAVVLLFLAVLAGWKVAGIVPNDDIRILQTQPPDLVAQEKRIRQLVGGVDTSRFLLVEGGDVETMLQRIESVQTELENWRREGRLGFFQSLGHWVPSKARQMENLQLLRENLLGSGRLLANYTEDLGFEAEVFERTRQSLLDPNPEWLTLERWLESRVAAPLRHLWLGDTGRGVASLILLGGVTDGASLEAMAEADSGLSYVNKVRDVSSLFSRYRNLATRLVLGAYGLILCLLWWRYGLRKGTLAMLPPLLAAWFSLAATSVLGFPVNLFSMLALLLVLGIGIDYTIFLSEVRHNPKTTMLAILLSSMTTVLSFGLLALSQTPVLRSFGLTLLMGIVAAMLLAPLVQFANGPDSGDGEVPH